MKSKIQLTYCILVALVIVLKIGLGQANSGECQCAAFDNEEGLDKPILAVPLPSSVIRVACNDDGAEDCRAQCNALGEKAPMNVAANFLCRNVHKTINFPQIYLFASNCDTGKWIRTEYKSLNSICCHAGKSVPCNLE